MENALDRLRGQHPGFLADARPSEDIVLGTQISLARNLRGFSFPAAGNHGMLQQAKENVLAALKQLKDPADPLALEIAKMSADSRQFLLERQLIGKADLKAGPDSFLLLSRDERFSVFVNGEDHLLTRVQAPGSSLASLWKTLNASDDALSALLPFAFHERAGYLTSDPARMGTGLRAAVLLHLPGLALAGQLSGTLQGIGSLGMNVCGFCKEEPAGPGNLYWIFNRSSLGESETQILDRLNAVVNQLSSHEQQARNQLYAEKRNLLLNHIGRAYGILRHGYLLTAEDAMVHLSALRLGVDMDLFASVDMHTVNDFLMRSLPAHLAGERKKTLSPEEDCVCRAELIRETLKARRG